jgi:uncharacterized protein YndB with AHSA1/START domain
MAHAEKSVVIKVPVEQAMAFLMNGKNNALWRQGVGEIEAVKTTPEVVGTVWKQMMTGPGGRMMPADYEITQYVPNRLLAFKVIAGPARPTGTYTFEENERGTKVTFVLDLQPKGILGRLMDGIVNAQMQKEVATLDSLKTYLEEPSQ